MCYPLMTLNDDTEIVHSEVLSDGRVKVMIETPDARDGFHSATCMIPGYTWENVRGYGAAEIAYYQKLIANMAHLIMRFAATGGMCHAASV